MTLNEAMEVVLKEYGDLSTTDIADIINKKHLYERGDKRPVRANQISARMSHHLNTFERTIEGKIHLL